MPAVVVHLAQRAPVELRLTPVGGRGAGRPIPFRHPAVPEPADA